MMKLEPVSLSYQAYQQIKQRIVSLELPPGSVLRETDLQQELHLGRTPIREALKRLSLEKLVVIVPRRGMFVSEIGLKDLQQLFEVRLVLESLAARLAAERGTAGHWQKMEAALARLTAEAKPEALMAIDTECHEIIYEAAQNRFLQDTLITYYALSLRLWYYVLNNLTDMRSTLQEHENILSALRVGDGDLAANLMCNHINTFQAEIQLMMWGKTAGTVTGPIPDYLDSGTEQESG
jgi:DNA-binding GntR family transcriptional regulator